MQDDEKIENRISLLCKLDNNTSSLREGVGINIGLCVISQHMCHIYVLEVGTEKREIQHYAERNNIVLS